mmetsp:Transcript_31790/g.68334  ORF Transcript_31790/g.68334 Transcript_31790/m.68334 type:complete len:292 (+) Transcript_31790:368-1243(+)
MRDAVGCCGRPAARPRSRGRPLGGARSCRSWARSRPPRHLAARSGPRRRPRAPSNAPRPAARGRGPPPVGTSVSPAGGARPQLVSAAVRAAATTSLAAAATATRRAARRALAPRAPPRRAHREAVPSGRRASPRSASVATSDSQMAAASARPPPSDASARRRPIRWWRCTRRGRWRDGARTAAGRARPPPRGARASRTRQVARADCTSLQSSPSLASHQCELQLRAGCRHPHCRRAGNGSAGASSDTGGRADASCEVAIARTPSRRTPARTRCAACRSVVAWSHRRCQARP